MKRLICVLIASAVLSGCGTPLKRIEPNLKPIINESSIPKTSTDTPQSKSNAKPVNEAPKDSETVTIDGKTTVKDPDSILVLVNKSRNLPSGWEPDDLVIPKVAFPFKGNLPQMHMRKEAAGALENLFNAALKDGIKLYAVSGYRAYSTQQRIYNNEVKKSGAKAANQVVALPGQSEHQTGLAMDVSCAGANYDLVESFENTKEGKWLKEHAKDFGFVIRYPKDKTDITHYDYEPWHIRYLGKEAAAYLASRNIVFDQYYTVLAQK